MKTLLLLLTLITTANIYAQQSVAYYYDDAGNRKQRKQCNCVGNRPANPNTDTTTYLLDANILPNPTKGKLAIEVTETTITNEQEGVVTATEITHFHVFVYDLYGREIINQQYNTAKFNIDITKQPPGVYFVKLIAGNKLKQWEIVKD